MVSHPAMHGAEDYRRLVLRLLDSIAPGNDVANLDPHADLQLQLDLDSVELADFVSGLAEVADVDISDEDAATLRTIDAAVAYLRVHYT